MPLTSSTASPPHLPKDFYAVTSKHNNIRLTQDKKSLVHGAKELSFSTIKKTITSASAAATAGGNLASRKVYHVVSDGRSINKSHLLNKQDSRLYICESFSDATKRTLQESIDHFDKERTRSPLPQETIDNIEGEFSTLMKNAKNLLTQKVEGLLNVSLSAHYAANVSLSGQDFNDVFQSYGELLGTLLGKAKKITARMNPPPSMPPPPPPNARHTQTTPSTSETPPPIPKKTHRPLTRVSVPTHAEAPHVSQKLHQPLTQAAAVPMPPLTQTEHTTKGSSEALSGIKKYPKPPPAKR